MSQNQGRWAGGSRRAHAVIVSTNRPGFSWDRPSSVYMSSIRSRATPAAPGSWAATQSAYVVEA